MKNRRIAFYIPALSMGGAQRVTVNVANALEDRGYQTDIVLSYRDGELLSDISDGVRLIDLRTPLIPYLGIGASLPRFVEYLRTVEPDILFSSMTYANLVAVSASMISGSGTRIVGVEHSKFMVESGLKNRLVNTIMKYGYRYVDHVVGVSEGVASTVAERSKIDAGDVSVIHNPIPISEIRDKSRVSPECLWLESPDKEVVLFAGRLAKVKDLDTLLRAFELLNEQHTNTRLIIAGKGPDKKELVRRAKELGLTNQVWFPGYVENPYAYMANASVFALSSLHEGLPMVLIEALACGCPVVSTDCPTGPREILADGEFGKLVPTGNPECLAKAIGETIEHPPNSQQLRRRAEDFSQEFIAEKYVELIDDLTPRTSPTCMLTDSL